MHIQDENKSNNNQNYRKWRWGGNNRETAFDCNWKLGGFIGTKKLAFCSGIILLFFETVKRDLLRARSVAFYTKVTHYCPGQVFPYNYLEAPNEMAPPIRHLGIALGQLFCSSLV